ncbi:MAG: hypothetical protein ACRCVU_19360, partial [Flavobacterium sp.]
ESKSTMNAEVFINGDEDFNEKLQMAGIRNPAAFHSEVTINTEITTGDRIGNKVSFKNTILDLDYVLTINDVKQPMESQIKGLFLTGNYVDGNTTEILNIKNEDGTEFDSETQELVKNMVSEMIKKIDYPLKPLLIGDSFKQEVEKKMPIMSFGVLQIKATNEYVLKSINNDKAYFDIVTSVDSAEAENVEVSFKGGGKGIMIYNSKNRMVEEGNNNFELDLIIKTEQFEMTSKTKSTSSSKVKKVN